MDNIKQALQQLLAGNHLALKARSRSVLLAHLSPHLVCTQAIFVDVLRGGELFGERLVSIVQCRLQDVQFAVRGCKKLL